MAHMIVQEPGHERSGRDQRYVVKNILYSADYNAIEGKGKGLGTCYSAAYETRTAALYNLRSGS